MISSLFYHSPIFFSFSFSFLPPVSSPFLAFFDSVSADETAFCLTTLSPRVTFMLLWIFFIFSEVSSSADAKIFRSSLPLFLFSAINYYRRGNSAACNGEERRPLFSYKSSCMIYSYHLFR